MKRTTIDLLYYSLSNSGGAMVPHDLCLLVVPHSVAASL